MRHDRRAAGTDDILACPLSFAWGHRRPPTVDIRQLESHRPSSLPRRNHPLQPRLRTVAAGAIVQNGDPKTRPANCSVRSVIETGAFVRW